MKKHLKKVVCAALTLAMVLGMTGCTTYNNFKAAFFAGEQTEKAPTIKIGIYESISGQNAARGKAEVLGIELAHELYPTVLGMDVELIHADNQSNMYVAETVIQELLKQKPAVILGSAGETVTLMASDYIKAASTPAITISAMNPLITSNNEFYFCATYTESRQGDALAEFAYGGDLKETVATVKFANDDAAAETIKRFTNKMKTLTGNNKCVKGSYTVPADTTDFGPTIEKIRNSGAETVFLAMNPAMAQTFLEQAMALELDGILWLGGRSWNDEKFISFLTKNPQLEAAYSSDFSYEVITEKSAELLELYRSRFGPDAVPDDATAVAFDAYLLALQAIETAQATVMETTVEDLAEKYQTEAALKAATEELLTAQETGVPSGRHIKMVLSTIKNFEGASGFISFSGKNEATKTITVHHYLGGEEIGHYHVG